VRTGSPPGVVGEIAAHARRRTLILQPGTYAVRGRAPDALLEGMAAVAAGRDTAVDPSQLDRAMYASLVRKGKGELLAGVSGPFASYTAQTLALYRRLVAVKGAMAGWIWVRPYITLSPRISAALFGPAWLVTADLRVTRTWDFGRLSIDLGFAAGGGMMYWRDSNYLLTSDRAESVVHVDPTAGVSRPLWGRTYLGAELAVQTYYLIFNRGLGVQPVLVTANLLFGTWL
jgi:hypothetical protein